MAVGALMQSGLKLSRYQVVTRPILDESDGIHKRVLFSTRTARAHVIEETTWQLIENARFDGLAPAARDMLSNAEVLVHEDEDELQHVISRNTRAAHTPSTHYTVVQPTANCQLGCDYCGQLHSQHLMSESDQLLIVKRIEDAVENRRYSGVEIAWFGGEPLLGLPVIRSMTPLVLDVARKNECSYRAKLVTNGLLLSDDVATELIHGCGVRQVEITLDGTAEAHDQRRCNKGGAPTFEKIFKNLISLCRRTDLRVEISVRCNVDRRNCEYVTPLIHALAEAGVQERIGFYAASVYSWGNTAHELALSPEEFAIWEIRWFIEQLTHGFRPSLLPSPRPVVCLAVTPDGRLFDAFGTAFNCTEVSYVPSYGSPNLYSIGSLSGQERPAQAALLGDFNSRILAGEYLCSDCRMLPVCGGSCPKKWREGFVPCPSAKRNIEDRLIMALALSRARPDMVQMSDLTG